MLLLRSSPAKELAAPGEARQVMKYEAKVDLRNANTSHALMVDLVGPDKRVLDVGCASGYLGEAMKQRGCTVAGIETDRESAEAAKAVLDEVVVADVGKLDLVAHFGAGSFDVVVFGDVLEHVVDPVGVLRRVRPLLSPSGYVVASIPNVAHGAVRLSLVRGRFDYNPLGLLDETHLRFFTRDSLHTLFRDAGFTPVDVRRTTAGIFETEIEVQREDFDDDLVEAVESDPDATTYQFVLKAVLDDRSADAPAPRVAAPAPAARCRVAISASCEPDDIRDGLLLRVTRAEISSRLPDAEFRLFTSRGFLADAPHTGGEPVEPLGDPTPERRRELADQIDCVVVTGDVRGGDATGGDIEPWLLDGLGPDVDVDCPVLWSAVDTGGRSTDLAAAATDRPYAALLDQSDDATPGKTGGELPVVPDPLLLLPHVLGAGALERRLEFLRIMGWYPREGAAVVVEVDAGMGPHAAAVAAALNVAAADHPGASIVLVDLDGDPRAAEAADAVATALDAPTFRLPAGSLADDLVAAIASAAVVAASSTSGVSLALAYDRPVAVVDLAGGSPPARQARRMAYLDTVVTRPGDLSDLLDEMRFRALPEAADELRRRLHAHFDRIASIADGAAAARPRTPDYGPALPPSHYVAALEVAHARMQRRVEAERRVMADYLADLRGRHATEQRRLADELAASRESHAAALAAALADAEERVDLLRTQVGNMATRLDRRHDEIRRLRSVEHTLAAELEAVRNSRSARLIAPARTVYGKLRGRP
ncbi:MAG: methyltransferase domain-containing protein [Acidimicrobiales bacterium]